jgi:MoaA/NifB/PqqE/SkfB family radical SAM enzyme
MKPGRDLTVLWALRSPCNLGCDYCYFGTLDEHRDNPPTTLGALSHLPHGDLPFADITAFLDSMGHSRIGRVFLAGGEPLIWPRTIDVVDILTRAGVEVVVCTNGLPLRRDTVRTALLELRI